MPCKHEGGTDPCVMYGDSHCRVRRRQYIRQYTQTNMRRTGTTQHANCDRGAAGEHFVIHWLLARRFAVGGPYNQNGKDDLFTKIGGEWRTVQVKLGQVNIKTGNIKLTATRGSITSDLIAVVDLEGMRIRWISNTDQPVPEELLQ